MSARPLTALLRDIAAVRGGGAFGPREREAAAEIVAAVRERGDAAVLENVRRFDRPAATARELVVTRARIRRAAERLEPEMRRALDRAHGRIRAFHAAQRPRRVIRRDGTGETALVPAPLDRIGALVPRGPRAYPSTALMTGVPARIAGVRELVVASPMPADGVLDPALAYALVLVDADLLLRAGGAAAVAALAYGTSSVPRADRIVGPGNRFTAAAKWLVSADVGIDTLQGPSELVIVASADAPADALALDLLAQAEHGGGAFAALASDSPALLEAVGAALRSYVGVAVSLYRARDLEAAARAADAAAPEHVLLAGAAAARLAPLVRRAGAVFVGGRSAVAFGDYVAGTNHCLPTGGTARWASALRVEDCVRWTSRVTMRGRLTPLVRAGGAIGRYERMRFHADSLEARK